MGAKYGSSRDQEYLNLRPKSDSASGASTTTYTFSKPTPTANWTFVLGDIDADQVRVRAIGPDGVALTAAQLGFNGGFNYCAPGVTGKPSCTGDAADIPTWDPGTLTLTGNAAAADTSGAAAWFEPTAPISSLTFSFQRRAGFPVYQTWFASLARDVTGTVTDTGTGDGSGVTLTLTDANGDVVATTTTEAGGTYSFPGVQASDGYVVRAKAPAGKIIDGATSKPADLADTDAVVDFSIRDIVPVAVSGIVTEPDGTTPIIGATIELTDGTNTYTVTTGADGSYLFDTVGVGTWTPTVTLPGGYVNPSTQTPFTIDGTSEDPIENVNFTGEKVILHTISGTITTPGGPASGITVTATGPDGTLTAVTDANGTYAFPGLVDGDYTITAELPDGTTDTQNVTVTGTNVPNIDFDVVLPGAVSGTITSSGEPVAGVRIVLTGGEDSPEIVTTEDGTFAFDSLPPGTYTIEITAPDGYTITGPATRTITINGSGAVIFDQDFTLLLDDVAADADTDADNGGNADAGGAAADAAAAAAAEGTAAADGATAGAGGGANAGTSGAGAQGGSGANTSGGSQGLARTGSDGLPALAIGGLVLLIGGVTVVLSGRRNTAEHTVTHTK